MATYYRLNIIDLNKKQQTQLCTATEFGKLKTLKLDTWIMFLHYICASPWLGQTLKEDTPRRLRTSVSITNMRF